MTACRLIVDGPAAGAWQMAVDEALLESAAERQQATLRFYAWGEPTLSLGYFQCAADRAQHAASRDCSLVRRQTGGGAILHDDELTYSLALPVAHPLSADARRLYDAAHQALVAVLAEWHIGATLRDCRDCDAVGPDHQEPFLCFQRRAAGDVLLGTAKVCGSAQRRRRGAILQHGSLLLGRSPGAPELPGLGELGRRPPLEPLLARWSSAIGAALGLTLAAGQLAAGELAAVRILTLEKYSGNRWNLRR